MTRLLIDAGNTNIKLAWVNDDNWSPVVSLPSNHACELGGYFSEYCGGPVQQVWVSNVAGAEVARQISDACAVRHWSLQFIGAATRQCGVHNGYELPEQLGSDRWAALIAAWHHVGAACLVVNSGTATTIDALSDSGDFIGGLILPGIALMRSSLMDATALLEAQRGDYVAFPHNTSDALFSGAIQASCGAVERQHALLDAATPVLLSGGAAHLLMPHLTLQVEMMDNLVLQGLLLIAREVDR